MPYRGDMPSFSFEGIQTPALRRYGHGKSAIVDAMTWALWGKTRAKSDDDLIHLGESEGEVDRFQGRRTVVPYHQKARQT